MFLYTDNKKEDLNIGLKQQLNIFSRNSRAKNDTDFRNQEIEKSSPFPLLTRCVCETRMPPETAIFFRNVAFIFDLDLCR